MSKSRAKFRKAFTKSIYSTSKFLITVIVNSTRYIKGIIIATNILIKSTFKTY